MTELDPKFTLFGERTPFVEDLRRDGTVTSKLAASLPATDEALNDYVKGGFDLVVVSRQPGRRRAGVEHPIEPTLRRSSDFTEMELSALSADAMLNVRSLR